RRLRWLVTPGVPHEVVAARSVEKLERFADWIDPPYDLIWFSKATTFALLDRPQLGPTIVDLDDLEDQKIEARLRAMGSSSTLLETMHGAGAKAQAKLNALRWSSLQSAVARSVQQVVLCSELDASRFGADNVTVVPNGYDVPAQPLGRIDVGDPPTIMLQGSLRYGPNADAAGWLVDEIAPIIRHILPTVEVRLVGEPDGSVSKLDDPPRVTVVGRVDSMEPELALADIVAVPIRYGSGTRVKILEAFAHRLPVVSTTLGAEGLGIKPDVHLLVADEPEAFAAACIRLLEDLDLRARLTEEAHRLFLERFQWSYAKDRIKELMVQVSTSTLRPPSHRRSTR
ncbi:MAG: glycosyltransferase family 4 protein, partial [Acidimicrobiales bacterium]